MRALSISLLVALTAASAQAWEVDGGTASWGAPDGGFALRVMERLPLDGGGHALHPLAGVPVQLFADPPAIPACPCKGHEALELLRPECRCSAKWEAFFALASQPPTTPLETEPTDANGIARFAHAREGTSVWVTRAGDSISAHPLSGGNGGDELRIAPPSRFVVPVLDRETRRPVRPARAVTWTDRPLRVRAASIVDGGLDVPDFEGVTWLVVEAPGYLRAIAPLPSADARGADSAVWLERPKSISGRIMRGGAPLAGARVCTRDGARCVMSDANGGYALGGFEPGSAYLLVTAGELAGEQAVALGEDRPDVDIQVTPTAAIEVQVLEADGGPVEKAQVHLSSAFVDLQAATDARGEFRAGSLAAGAYSLVATAPHRVDHVLDLDLKSGERRREAVQLGTFVSVSGKVLDRRGRPVSGARVYVYPPDKPRYARICVPEHGNPTLEQIRAPPPWGTATSAADGTFRIDGVGSGPVRIEASIDCGPTQVVMLNAPAADAAVRIVRKRCGR